jgi:DNA polymerase III delta prime subunit
MTVELWYEKYRPKTIDEYVWKDLNQKHKVEEWIAAGATPHVLFSGSTGTGKAQPLSSKVLTPKGWVLMQDLQLGDIVVTPSGRNAPIIGIFPQGLKTVYQIVFDDGKTTQACAEHLWEVKHSDWRKKSKNENYGIRVLPTDSLEDKLQKLSLIKTNHRLGIRLCEPVDFSTENNLPIHPYVLGCLLGDGCLTEEGSIRISSADEELLTKFESLLPEGLRLSQCGQYDYRIIGKNGFNFLRKNKKGIFCNPLKIALNDLGLIGTYSHTKFIPEGYKYAPLNARKELLMGLMDTDGTVCSDNSITHRGGGALSYCSVSQTLSKDVQELVWSLGGIAKITIKTPSYTYKKEKKLGRLAYSVNIRMKNPEQVFSLSRKIKKCPEKYQYKGSICNNIKSITALDEKVEMQCIMIDDPEHLYITDDYIPTHNTALAELLMKELGIPKGDILKKNASKERRIDDLQNSIVNFASTWALNDTGFKYVILDEADTLSPLSQKFLRGEMDKFEASCRFIFTCNYPKDITDPILGRVQEMKFHALDRNECIVRAGEILTVENVEFDIEDLMKYVEITYPNLRKCIGLLQQNTVRGKLNPPPPPEEITTNKDYLLEAIVCFRQNKILEGRKLIIEKAKFEEYPDIYRYFYKNLDLWGDQKLQDEALLIISRGLIDHSICADSEINLSATLCRLGRLLR